MGNPERAGVGGNSLGTFRRIAWETFSANFNAGNTA